MRREQGFTLLETILATGVLAVVFLGLAAMMGLGAAHTRTVELEALLLSKAQELADQVRAVPFGKATDPIPGTAAVKEVFDADPQPGSVTLLALERAGGNFLFSTADPDLFPDGFPVPGVFRVRLVRRGTSLLDRARSLDPNFTGQLTSTPADREVIRVRVWFRQRGETAERLLLHTTFTAPREEN